MSDLPERIWLARDTSMPSHPIFESYPDREPAREYLRADHCNDIASAEYTRGFHDGVADLAPAVGYSREQMEDALRHFIGPFRSIDIEFYMNSLTPAAEVPIPTVEELELVLIKAQQFRESIGSYRRWETEFAVCLHQLLTKGRGGA
jgi:hypothetical protein